MSTGTIIGQFFYTPQVRVGRWQVVGTLSTINGAIGPRKISLLDRSNDAVLKVTWSDTGGNYSFTGLEGPPTEYIGLAVDYTNVWSAVAKELVLTRM